MTGMVSTFYGYLLILNAILMILYTSYTIHERAANNSLSTKRSNRTHLLILTSWRSGSSFVGQLFNQNPNVFYLFEPTKHVWAKFNNQNPTLLHLPMRDLLKSVFMCDMSAFQPYLSQAKYISDLFMWYEVRALCSPPACEALNRFDIIDRPTCKNKCLYSTFDKVEEACKTYSHVVVKTVRFLDLKILYPLLRDPQLNLKILHLVRDPRAIFSSREHFSGLRSDNIILARSKIGKPNIYFVMFEVCRAQVNIHQTAMRDSPYFLNNRYMMVRYEDLVNDPQGYIDLLYHYAGLSMSTMIKSWVYNITNNVGPQENGFMSYTKDSMKRAHLWRHRLSFQKVKLLQRVCQQAMDVFGYQQLRSEEEQKNLILDLVLPKKHNLF
ncbi:carbohydrate sulfotransferase 6-like [Lissotriton helveticus]